MRQYPPREEVKGTDQCWPKGGVAVLRGPQDRGVPACGVEKASSPTYAETSTPVEVSSITRIPAELGQD